MGEEMDESANTASLYPPLSLLHHSQKSTKQSQTVEV